AKLNLQCHLVLCRRYGQAEDQGNCLLMRLFGAHIHWYDGPLGEAYESHKRELRDKLKSQGRKPYVINYPTSEILGTIAFVSAAVELHEQCLALNWRPHVVTMAAVGSTQSGLLLGLRWLGWSARVIGYSPLREEFPVVQTLRDSMAAAGKRLDLPNPVTDADILSVTDFVGEGYAKTTRDSMDAMSRMARTEGVLLDPVYTSKAMAGTLAWMADGRIDAHADVLFVHTGGVPAIFAYNQPVLQHLASAQESTPCTGSV
ncbi:MAG: pyridoxal-phosphate dependent enzyme, partial [Phycisphaeraceae bacterium]|nr:pyridoxal-phosphate dependent enzyme [Phycisphaeraceae bacterium]